MERMLIHSRVRCPRCYQAQQGNEPARMLSLVRPAGVGLRAHQRLLAEDTGSLGALPSGWGVLGRSELGKAGAGEWRGGPETSHCSVPVEHGVERSRRAGLRGPTPLTGPPATPRGQPLALK